MGKEGSHVNMPRWLLGCVDVLAARDMAERLRPPERVFTFGCPRIGDRRFRASTLGCVARSGG